MKFDEITTILEDEPAKRKYVHRKGYDGNKKGSYIKKGKTKWDYSSGKATPGNERIVTQIQNIAKKNGKSIGRGTIKKWLDSSESQKVFDSFKKRADKAIGTDQDNSHWRGYVYGGFTKIAARIIANK